MSNRTTFRLPGHELNGLAERKCLLSFLAAYSKQWNPRNLEAPWYEPWTQIFADLVAGHASLSVAPQAYLWYDLAHQESQPHTTPGPYYLMSTEDEQLDDGLLDDVGNITLDSLKSISVPSYRNRCRIPDIVITRKVSHTRLHDTSQLSYLARRVTYLGIPLLAELKVSGARCHDIQTSLNNAVLPMSFAREQVMKQALHLFKMYPHQNSVILVAITGFWWSCRIYLRAQTAGMEPVDGEENMNSEDLNEEPDSTLLDQNGIHPELAQVSAGADEPSTQILREQLYGFNLDTFGSEGIAIAQRARFRAMLPEDHTTLSETQWSDYLLYGTPASNQMLSLVHDRLHSVVHVHYDGRMG